MTNVATVPPADSTEVTVLGEVEVKNDTGNPVPVSGTVSVSEPVSVDDNGGSLTVDGSVSVSNFPASVEVSNDAGNALPVSAASLPLPTNAATSGNQTTEIGHLSRVAGALVPAAYDYISLGYTGSNLTSAIFKAGGAGGSTVKTLALAYTGARLDTVTAT